MALCRSKGVSPGAPYIAWNEERVKTILCHCGSLRETKDPCIGNYHYKCIIHGSTLTYSSFFRSTKLQINKLCKIVIDSTDTNS